MYIDLKGAEINAFLKNLVFHRYVLEIDMAR